MNGIVVHHAPPEWGETTGCCGILPWDLARPYRLSDYGPDVTCRGPAPASRPRP